MACSGLEQDSIIMRRTVCDDCLGEEGMLSLLQLETTEIPMII